MELSDFVNLAILRHPTNWLLIFVAMAIVAFGADLVVTYFSQPQNLTTS